MISHYGFDCALLSALSRLMRQRRATCVASATARERCVHERILPLTGWVVTAGCANHDAQNALTWAVFDVLDSPKESMKELFVVAEALKNSLNILQKLFAAILARCDRFCRVTL